MSEYSYIEKERYTQADMDTVQQQRDDAIAEVGRLRDALRLANNAICAATSHLYNAAAHCKGALTQAPEAITAKLAFWKAAVEVARVAGNYHHCQGDGRQDLVLALREYAAKSALAEKEQG